MTKYEFKHNRNHNKIYVRKGIRYVTPTERIVIICLINIIIIIEPFIFVFSNYYVGLFLLLVLGSMFLWSEYNIFYNWERIHYFFYAKFGKDNVYKKLIIDLSQYENVVKYEQKLGVRIRKSYCNCKKVIFLSKNHRGYLTHNHIKFNGKRMDYNINDFGTIREYINFIKVYMKK